MRTTQEFIELVKIKNPTIQIIDEYKGARKKILCKCKKCQYIWEIRADHLLEGHGCPKCGGALKKNNELFLKQFGDKQQLIEPLEEYINAKTKILCRCKICHNEWKALPNKLLEGNGCPLCASRKKTSFPEQAIYYYIKQVFPDAVNRYNVLKNKCELDIYIPQKKIGIEYDGIYWHKNKTDLEKSKYKICKSKGITLFRIRENEGENDEEEVSADYIILRKYPYVSDTLDNSIKLLMKQMNIKANVDTKRDSIKIQEQYYRELACNSLQQKYPNVSEEWEYEKNGNITPAKVSYASNERYWWKCKKCQYIWRAQVADRTVGRKGCPKCKGQKSSERYTKSNEQFLEELKKINPYIQPLEEYKKTHIPILVRCIICGNEWKAAPANMLRGKQCPVCTRKRNTQKLRKSNEKFIMELKKINSTIEPLEEYTNCKTPVLVKCTVCGREWKALPTNLLKGTKCKICMNRAKKL